MSDKTQIIQRILEKLTEQYDNAVAAVQQAHDSATHEENIADNKYDTLGLEAGYLAFGQAQRVAECAADLEAWKAITVTRPAPEEPIQIGALITLIDEADKELRLFLGPAAGGITIQHQGQDITVVTTGAPLGKALSNKYQDDEFELKIGDNTKNYFIESVE